jgi:hypothetical protein
MEHEMPSDWTIVQAHKLATFGDVTVMGSQYRDSQERLIWRFRVHNDQYHHPKIYQVIVGEKPIGKTEDESDAMAAAMKLWCELPPQPINVEKVIYGSN